MKKTILFDIDYTLIDCDIIKKRPIENIAKNFGIEIGKINEARDKYYEGLKSTSDIDPDELLGVIQKQIGVPLVELKKIYYDTAIYIESLYPGVIETIEQINLEKFQLGVFSEGRDYYQKFKLEASEILPYFDQKLLYVKRRKKSPQFIRSLPKGSLVIDDRLDVVKELKRLVGWKQFG
jgi:FMN phosphatase YigB (HAD superfamily)